MSWDLSPSSARKRLPDLAVWRRAWQATFRRVVDDQSVIEHRSKVSPTVGIKRFASRAFRQYVDSTIRDYSPSLTSPG